MSDHMDESRCPLPTPECDMKFQREMGFEKDKREILYIFRKTPRKRQLDILHSLIEIYLGTEK